MNHRYSASYVASCVGQNPYESLADKLESCWLKRDSQSYFKFVNLYKPKDSYLKKVKLLKKSKSSSEAKEAQNIQNDTSLSVEEKVSKIRKIEKTTLSKEEHELLIKDVKSNVSTKHGIAKEQSALDIYADSTGQVVGKIDKLMEKEYGTIIVNGKVDGIVQYTSGEYKIVEIKNRTRRLFGKVVNYEYCQVQCYLYIHNQKFCDLVENYKGKINIFTIERDDDFIKSMLNVLVEFDKLIGTFQYSTELWDEYSKSDREHFILHVIGGEKLVINYCSEAHASSNETQSS